MSSAELATHLTNNFSIMPEDVFKWTWVGLSFAIRMAANNADNIFIGNLLHLCGDFMEKDQILSVLFQAFKVGRAIVYLPMTPAAFQEFFNFGVASVATYIPDSGIAGYWLFSYLESLNLDWTQQIMRDLSSYRR